MIFRKILRSIAAAATLATISLQAEAVALTKLDVSTLSAGRTQLEMTFDGPAPEPVGYSVERPARIALDFAGTENRLQQKRFPIGSGNLRNAVVVSTADRTRLVLSMATLMPYNTTVSGRRVRIIVGPGVQQSRLNDSMPALEDAVNPRSAKVSYSSASPTSAEPAPSLLTAHWLGDKQLQLKLSNDRAQARIYQSGHSVQLRLAQYRVSPAVAQHWDALALPAAVQSMNVFQDDDDAVIQLQLSRQLELEAYQAAGVLTLALQPETTIASALEASTAVDDDSRLSMNLQDVEVRFALQQIADYVGLNLVAADSVQGRMTLRLQEVPWQEALDLVLRSKNLDKRLNGNVLLIAPAQELAEQEQLALENQQRAEQLAPLQTDFIQVNYAKADDILGILNNPSDSEEGAVNNTSLGFLSERGAVSIDTRTNTLIIRDTADNLADIRRAVEHFDVPVRQVLIEARIVAARTSVGEQFGVRWGGNINSGGSSPLVASGSVESTSSIGSALHNSGGTSYEQVYPDALVVDLPVVNPSATSFAIGVAAFDYALDLELSALETRGSAEVISQPRVVTSNGQEAFINSGQTIAFDGAEGGTTFVDAGLSLRVTPQITPDSHVVLDLVVTQDSLAAGGGAIDTNSVTTQVLVNDGETLVLGGVYRTETVTTVEKTPWLGDLPVLGRLFRRTSEAEEKTEMLVFITPSLVVDYVAAN
ncbi:type IV pilus secretin PilQ [Saccharospirillum sp. HFRX-1]|uniref:type IV pilus secretin PilQ n=1 Tax=unclassified Saccharospirillum TaxID=2633430 RepID=UPI003719272A